MYDYKAGKQDWMGAGLPTEGTNAQVMRPGPSTYRPFVSVQEMQRTMTERNVESSPVTTSDGKLVGLVRRRDIGAPG